MAPLQDLTHPARSAVPFARDLALHGERTALIAESGELSYRELALRVAATADRLGPVRRLVLLAAANDTETVVTYLAALSAGHPLLLVPADRSTSIDALTSAYDPDVIARQVDGAWQLAERRQGTAHQLHPDLALLLSTSGSTGAPKLVRLSHDNLQSNADAIASYLAIRPTDRAATTLPLHYCYGLSVLNSHLARGAGVVLTDLSVLDDCFWALMRERSVTSFAGVPYTFDLLDRVGFADLELPALRYVTQAGGRLAPESARRYAELGQRHGFDLFLMYGQTEATARMAYLPPDLAAARPEAIGVPIPGGSFTLDPVPGVDDGGELVYSGPNVMLGYAERPADLALGRTVDELRTGDIARLDEDGLYEIVGRRSGFLKLFGLRIDPQTVEAALAARGVTACCTGEDDQLVVAFEGPHDPGWVRSLAVEASGLPRHALLAVPVPAVPRLASGKPDRQALAQIATPRAVEEPAGHRATSSAIRSLYAELLGHPDVTDEATFVSLRGDSLSYVELSVRLEQLLGELPTGWHTRPIRDLATTEGPARARGSRSIETGVLLRAVAIVLIVGSHAKLFALMGGAHLLLGVAGFNLARFQLATPGRAARTRHLTGTAAALAAASVSWIALMSLLAPGEYGWANLLLANWLFGPDSGSEWRFWFLEALVLYLLVIAALLAVPVLDRVERRRPFAVPMLLVALALIARFDLIRIDVGRHDQSPHVVFWLFALGWAAARAAQPWQRWLVTAVLIATVPGFFGTPAREAVVVVGMLLLLWLPTVRLPAILARVTAVLAGSSLYIYLTHFHVYGHIRQHSSALAVLVSLAVGVLYARQVAPRAGAALRWARRRAALRWNGAALRWDRLSRLSSARGARHDRPPLPRQRRSTR